MKGRRRKEKGKSRLQGILIGFLFIFILLLNGNHVVLAQDAVAVSVNVRQANGVGASEETILLQNFLDDTGSDALPCVTDADGLCVWEVSSGLYQLLFDYLLDAISQLTVAEGGLSGLGITVGESAITYHLTLQPDGRVYFDAAPDAALPSPIIPTVEDIRQHALPTTTTVAVEIISQSTPGISAETPTPSPPNSERPTGEGETQADNRVRHSLLYISVVYIAAAIAGGVGIGVGLHRWTRKRGGKPNA